MTVSIFSGLKSTLVTTYVSTQAAIGIKVPQLNFITDKTGMVVSQQQRKVMHEKTSRILTTLFGMHEDPPTWKKKTQFASNLFSNTMWTKFIEFCLCQDGWKIEKYGSIKYPDWVKGSQDTRQLKCMQTLPFLFLMTNIF